MKEPLHDVPGKCPITGEPLYITELTSTESGVVIRGKFKLPKIAQLDAEHARILEVFIRSRGVISTMEKELGLSYPTVRARVDSLLNALDYEPLKPPAPATSDSESETVQEKKRILELLEEGTITAKEATARLKEVASK